jgi:hypothetical protein
MKIKIQFGEETRFIVPNRQVIQPWAQWLPALRLSLRALVLAEAPKPLKRRMD